MTAPRQRPGDLDSPWKEILHHFLQHVLALFFPDLHDAIDWQRGYDSLDKELQQIVHDARTRRRLADKLFKVWLKDGREAWLLIHIEVQGQRETGFPERMFIYNYPIYDRYRRQVVSLAVLTDDQPDWRPDRFEYNRWGCSMGIRFRVAKVLDYRGREEELERSRNPFAAVVLAQLKALETRQAPQSRWQWKVRLIKGLYERGLTAEEVRQLFRLLDWMLALPEELDEVFHEELFRFQEEKRMPYITSIERLAMKKGRAEGEEKGRAEGEAKGRVETLHQAIALELETRFGAAGLRLMRKVRAVREPDRLWALLKALKTAQSLDEVRPLLTPTA